MGLKAKTTVTGQPTVQITVRGVDLQTKQLLEQQAAKRGMSMNTLAVESLRRTAGALTAEERYKALKQSIDEYRISSEDIKVAEESIAWMDRNSARKQRRDEAGQQ